MSMAVAEMPTTAYAATLPFAFFFQPALRQTSEIILDQGPRRKVFRPNRGNGAPRPQGQRPTFQRPVGSRLPGLERHSTQNARNNYERYTTMAKDAARRGDVVEAENYYQHAEHYFRVMKEQD